jgi:hypothetical protein
MSANESDAYHVMRMLDVDYILVLFGGLTGYASDDINKFLWMVRIGGSVYPWIKESDYLSKRGTDILAVASACLTCGAQASSEWTRTAPPPCSIRSCTRCASTASARS